jgi:hypothetical protein
MGYGPETQPRRLVRVPAGWNHPAEEDSRQINMLEHVLVAKPLRTLAGHALACSSAFRLISFHDLP